MSSCGQVHRLRERHKDIPERCSVVLATFVTLGFLISMTTEHCDVLIVGAGPVGLLLALMLHKQGVNVRIVERQKALYPLPRAVTLDHEARRLMGTIGLAERLDEVIENVVGKGGEDGTNFVWRDADLKREYW